MTWRTPASSAYARFRALPVVWQGAAVVLALVALLWLYGALDGAVSGVRDWWTDRELNELRAERDQLKLEHAYKDGVIDAERAHRAEIQQKLDAIIERENAQAAKGAEEDARIVTTRKRYEDARRGNARRPASDGELDADLRSLYPEP
jgi:hypothetical protein